MSLADLMRSLVDGGGTSLTVLGALPVAVGGVSWLLAKGGRGRASQLVANAGIAVGLMALVVAICALIWSSQHGLSVVADVGVEWLVLPVYLVVAGFLVEHWVHPGHQEDIREQIRSAALVVIVLAVLYWLLSSMRVFMLVHTGILGLLLFIGALVGIFYVLMRTLV
jgi:hypothetical protein